MAASFRQPFCEDTRGQAQELAAMGRACGGRSEAVAIPLC